ncbi:TolC family protein [Hydrotalea sandarakina]|jgi:cobalt-zinc-cadmium efflux system outer membrane protein|uniref:Cobalt-zinc-cadmium efflux system outer membrane protein n=1 Tax=Hydrotalea sandarakina TaxID=1004304 RepID=A0A2W7RYE7_9BACT|nr:TolC family protein [Hydrotalea sandarakina]PZX65808.1 cobalt-zinc-cadmium efflux system outer membrane protein [Hydrotalea sandarakina]
MLKLKQGVLLAISIFSFGIAMAQWRPPVSDTIHLTIDSAENIFLRNNLLLLAQRYNIDAQKALIIQAKLYPNPNINISQMMIQPVSKKILPFGSEGEIQATLSQMIILAGKRNKQIKLAETNAKLAEYQFYDLMRTLRYTLRTDFYNIYYLTQSSKVYQQEINALQQVVTAFEEQQSKGYIAEKEVVRIKAQLYSLQSEYNDLINQINDTESELRLVLQIKDNFILPEINEAELAKITPNKYPLATLIDSAYQARTDLKIAKAYTDMSKQNYDLQKALAVPDLTLQLGYDQQGNYINNFNSIGFGIDVPIFNRNQGNIKSAKSMIDYNATTQKSTEASIEEQIYRALQKAYDNTALYQKIDPSFGKDFDRLKDEVLNNYKKRNISLLDFLDFYDAYKQNTLQINAIKFNRISAFEDLNYFTGTSLF